MYSCSESEDYRDFLCDMSGFCHFFFLQALDGKVERDENGKEIRHPVLLTAQEKLIARKVCMAFKVFMPLHRQQNRGVRGRGEGY